MPMRFLLLSSALLLWGGCDALLYNGVAEIAAGSVVLLEKFCFSYDKDKVAGTVDVSLDLRHGPLRPDAPLKLLLLDDQRASYADGGGWDRLTCQEQISRARVSKEISFDSSVEPASFHDSVAIAERIRPRWWWVALANCGGETTEVDYSVHVLNPLFGWQAELSSEQVVSARHGLSVLHFCVLLWFVVICLGIVQSVESWRYRKLGLGNHPLGRLMAGGLCCSIWATSAYVVYFLIIVEHGVSYASLYLFGMCWQKLSKFLLMAVLMLTARGRCITFKMAPDDLAKLLKLLAPFLLLTLALESWDLFAPSTKLRTSSLYGSPAGLALLLMDLWLLSKYVFWLRLSYRYEWDPEKKHFYLVWGSLCSAWFLLLPTHVVLGYLVAPWVSYMVSTLVSHTGHALMYAVLLAALWPSTSSSVHSLSCLSLDDAALRPVGRSDSIMADISKMDVDQSLLIL